jgi:hypothetical protein
MSPPRLAFTGTSHPNDSTYTLATVHSQSSSLADDHEPLLTPALPSPSYGATFPRSPSLPSSRKVILNATIKMASIFVISTIVLGGTLWLTLPPLEESVFVFIFTLDPF